MIYGFFSILFEAGTQTALHQPQPKESFMAAQSKPSSPAVPRKPSTTVPDDVQVLKRSSCRTLSGKSTLHYELGLDSKQTPLFRITACTGGGFFSTEWVSLAAIRSALQKSKAVTAILLFPLFKGKSVNTPGYLLAVLRAEKLIQALPGKTRIHELCSDWDDRVASLLSGDSGKAKPATKAAAKSNPKSSVSPRTNSKPAKKLSPRSR
jgi:hypothetical protein